MANEKICPQVFVAKYLKEKLLQTTMHNQAVYIGGEEDDRQQL